MSHATATVDVGGLLWVLDAKPVGGQLRDLPGVHNVNAYYVTGSATLFVDPAVTSIEAMRSRIRDCGYRCGGEILASYLCATEATADVDGGHRAATTYAREGRNVDWR